MEYTPETLLRLTKRWNNPKRPYLLVNPLQGKHIPASPAASWAMMERLGRRLAERYPDTKLVVGFAETATAVAAAAAGCFGEGCVYIHTTRENIPSVESWVMFQEEHSHAVEQKLCGDRLAGWLRDTPQLLVIDDELSTGKTIINITNSLRERYPELEGKRVVAASLLNRLSPENTARFTDAGIESEYLVKLPEADYAAAVEHYSIEPAEDLRGAENAPVEIESVCVDGRLPDPRVGVAALEYADACGAFARNALAGLRERLPAGGEVLVLGTEECMYPALVLGKAVEELGVAGSVSWYATTRSPIGICREPGYPVTEGYKVRSFYADDRETFLYNMRRYDLVVVLSDGEYADGLRDVAKAVYRHGCRKLVCVRGE